MDIELEYIGDDNCSNFMKFHFSKDLKGIFIDLLKYERYFYKTGKKSKFNILTYFDKINHSFRLISHEIDPMIIFYTKYNKYGFIIKTSEILDRLISVNENFDINTIIFKMEADIKILYYFRNTSLFMMLGKTYMNINYNIIKKSDIPHLSYMIGYYIGIYISEIINNTSDNNFINGEIDLFKKIINNLYMLDYKDGIIKAVWFLLYNKHIFQITEKKVKFNFCNVLLEYILCDLNLIETIEYGEDLKGILSKNIIVYSNIVDMNYKQR